CEMPQLAWRVTTTAGTCKSGVGAPLRIVGGKESFEGRVEVYHDGKWGTICDDQWDDRDAEVVCRQLGLSGTPKALSWAHYGQGSGPILLDEVQCSGNELSLDQCKKSDWGQQNCDHIEDAGVSCDPFTGTDVQLCQSDAVGLIPTLLSLLSRYYPVNAESDWFQC
uniref:SRCR domain-containing protein n=1 Tax=Junco hyemalis TaxID=40217 RepID=A0A8C5JVM0_JUNHY